MVRLETRRSPGAKPKGAIRVPDDRSRDLLLGRENIGELAVVVLAPEMRPLTDLDELRGDTHAVAHLAHRAFDRDGSRPAPGPPRACRSFRP